MPYIFYRHKTLQLSFILLHFILNETNSLITVSPRIKRETHQRDCPRDVSWDVASVFQTHYFIIGTTYQRDDVRDRQRDLYQNCYISVAPAVALDVASVVALDSHAIVCRRVPNRPRVGVFCSLT